MSFLNGLLDFIAAFANEGAKKFDKMSDEELEMKCSKPVDEMRNSVQAAHTFYEHRQNRKGNDEH